MNITGADNMNVENLTIHYAQRNQPWTVPYPRAFTDSGVPHILGSHVILHAAKSVGKMATVFEALDHTLSPETSEQIEVLRCMSADLLTAAMRVANLYGFDLARALVERVEEKNGVDILDR